MIAVTELFKTKMKQTYRYLLLLVFCTIMTSKVQPQLERKNEALGVFYTHANESSHLLIGVSQERRTMTAGIYYQRSM